MEGFWDEHIFRADESEWNESFRAEMEQVFRTAIVGLPSLWKELPEEWTEAAPGFTFESARILLSRFEHDPSIFWRTS